MQVLKLTYKYLKQHPLLSILALGFIVAASVFDGISLSMLIPLIQSMVAQGPVAVSDFPVLEAFNSLLSRQTQVQTVSLIFGLLFLLILSKNVFIYLSRIYIAKLRFAVMKSLKNNLMSRLIDYDVQYFDSVKKGYLISNLSEETTRMADFIAAVLDSIVVLARMLAYTVVLFLISWRISLGIFAAILVILAPLELIMRKIKRLGRRISQALVDYNYKLTEILGGIRLIKASGTEELEKRQFQAATDKTYDLQYKINRYSGLVGPLSEVAIFGLIVLGFLILVNTSIINTSRIFPYLATYLLVLARMLMQLNLFNNWRSEALGRLAAFSSYDQLYDQQGKRTIHSGNKQIDKFSDCIEFKKVSFAYVSRKQILQDVDLKIPKGKMTAIVGVSGVGKSTLVNLIARFYESGSSGILVDGIDLRQLSLRPWRRKLGFVSQDAFIFNASVKENIAYGHQQAGEQDVIRAANTAGAHDFIMQLPRQYQTILGERGVRLSGGQKQRISIARAIIHNPEILILDEATSSLDSETETSITQAIKNLTKERTVVAIAHRLSTVHHADNIVVLDEGRVVESGRHTELLSKNGVYKRLYGAQFSSKAKG